MALLSRGCRPRILLAPVDDLAVTVRSAYCDAAIVLVIDGEVDVLMQNRTELHSCASIYRRQLPKRLYLSDLLTLSRSWCGPSSTTHFTALSFASNSADIVSAVTLAMGVAEEMQTAMVNRSIRTIKAVGATPKGRHGQD